MLKQKIIISENCCLCWIIVFNSYPKAQFPDLTWFCTSVDAAYINYLLATSVIALRWQLKNQHACNLTSLFLVAHLVQCWHSKSFFIINLCGKSLKSVFTNISPFESLFIVILWIETETRDKSDYNDL